MQIALPGQVLPNLPNFSISNNFKSGSKNKDSRPDLEWYSAGQGDAVVSSGVCFPSGRAGVRRQVLLQHVLRNAEQPLRRHLQHPPPFLLLQVSDPILMILVHLKYSKSPRGHDTIPVHPVCDNK